MHYGLVKNGIMPLLHVHHGVVIIYRCLLCLPSSTDVSSRARLGVLAELRLTASESAAINLLFSAELEAFRSPNKCSIHYSRQHISIARSLAGLTL